MRLLFTILLLAICSQASAQRFVEDLRDRAALKARQTGNLNQSIYIRYLVSPGDGLGGLYSITNSVVGADDFYRIQSTQDPTFAYDRWLLNPLSTTFNFGDQFTITGTNITLSTNLSLTNLVIIGSTTTPAVELGAVCGTVEANAAAGSEFNLLLTCDTTLVFTNGNWQDFHNINLTLTNTGNYSLIISTPAYDQYWYPTGDSTQVTNDWGAGIVNRFALWKTGGRILGSQKEGLSVSTLTKEVYSGNYGGLLPADVPVVSAALSYDLDSPGVMYFWNGVNWY